MDDDRKDRAAERDAQIEARAAEAYDDLHDQKRDKNDWAKWMFIADGLMLGRRWAMARAGTQAPEGRGYNTAFGQWMATRHWARDLDKPTRNDLFWCAEHRSEIEAWRDELQPQERAKKNHPSHMRRAYGTAHKPHKDDADGTEGDDAKVKKGTAEEEALRKHNVELTQTIVKLRDNPFPWWSGSTEQGARSMFEDRPDGNRADGRARQLLIALAKQFKDRFPSQTAQLLDEVIAILRGPSETVAAAAAQAVDALVKEGRKQAKTVRRAGRMAKREAKEGGR
jgi:hypothetical protein